MSAGRGRRKKQKGSANGHEPEVGAQQAPAAEPAADGEGAEASDEQKAAASEPGVEDEVQQTSSSEHDADGDAPRDEPDEPDEGAETEPPELDATTDAPEPAELDRQQQKAVLEALVFVSERTVTAAQLARAMKVRAAQVRELIAELMQDYGGRGMELIEVAGGYQLRSAPACAAYVREFVAQKPVRLTRAQLETLALIAYRQPITRPEIDEVRGVDSGSAIRVLLERSLIKMLGRKDEPGRPLLYGTTSHFLEFFGMRSLKDLPTLREFTELSDENRALFKRKTGESVEEAEAELLAADDAQNAADRVDHISDEDLAELAADAETDIPPPPPADAVEGEGEGAADDHGEPARAGADEDDEQDAASDVEAADAHDGIETADPA